MTGFEYLKKQMIGQEDPALQEVVSYLLTRYDMEEKYLNLEKTLKGMCEYIKRKANKHQKNGWTFFQNDVVFAWTIMYYNFPNKVLGIKETKLKKNTSSIEKNTAQKQNVISIEDAKKVTKQKIEQLSLFGGAKNEDE